MKCTLYIYLALFAVLDSPKSTKSLVSFSTMAISIYNKVLFSVFKMAFFTLFHNFSTFFFTFWLSHSKQINKQYLFWYNRIEPTTLKFPLEAVSWKQITVNQATVESILVILPEQVGIFSPDSKAHLVSNAKALIRLEEPFGRLD